MALYALVKRNDFVGHSVHDEEWASDRSKLCERATRFGQYCKETGGLRAHHLLTKYAEQRQLLD